MPNAINDCLNRLRIGEAIVLDGGNGTEMERRGVLLSEPLWTTSALTDNPEVVKQVHRDYCDAGAEIVTANTFRTQRFGLAKSGRSSEAAQLTCLAVDLARDAVEGRAWIAGSQAPLEDCYRPDRVPDDNTLQREHENVSQNLAAAGVDMILVETHNCLREAYAACRAAKSTGLPTFVSLVCKRTGEVYSGESLSDVSRRLQYLEPDAIGINCAPVSTVSTMLREIKRAVPQARLIAYGNTGQQDESRDWQATIAATPEEYADCANQWVDIGAAIVGGCCGTTPLHIARMCDHLKCRRTSRDE